MPVSMTAILTASPRKPGLAAHAVGAPMYGTLTAFDRSVAQIHYSRPPGNTNLDRDHQALPAGALSPSAGSISEDWGCHLSLDG